jgi:electron transfer flavoprotein alpha subunit
MSLSYQEVLVCGEIVDGKMDSVTRELLNLGRKLCDELNQSLSFFFVGNSSQEVADEAISLGSDKVYIVIGPHFTEFHPDVYTAIIAKVSQQIAPSVILFGHTDLGCDVAPRLAAKLRATVVMDCTDLSIDPETGKLFQTKPVYGGNAMAVWSSESFQPQIVTLRPRSVMPAEPLPSRKGEIVTLDIDTNESKIESRLLETVRVDAKGIKLEDAKVIIAGGGGIGGSEGFKLLEELAKVLGGTIAVTRVPCDEGWMPVSLEIGQTSHIVAPQLYIAVGISGALQHMAGCSGSKCIVGINKDPVAQIFKWANLGVVGDYRDVLPTLIAKLKEFVKM